MGLQNFEFKYSNFNYQEIHYIEHKAQLIPPTSHKIIFCLAKNDT